MIFRNSRAAVIFIMLAAFCLTALMPGFAVPAARAEAARELLKIQVSARPEEMVEPGDVMLSFTIENTSAVDAQNVYLSSANGLLSEPVGQLAAGEVQSFNRQHSVTAQELDAGEIGYTISHDDPSDPSRKVNYVVTAAIRRSDVQPQAEFTRQFSSRFVAQDDTLVITYQVRNTGNVALSNLLVQDSLGDFTGGVDHLDAGESRTLISRTVIEDESVSAATLDYSAEGMQERISLSLSEAEIHLAKDGMDAAFSAALSPFSTDSADVMLVLSNTGNTDIHDICITDANYGGVIADSLTLPAGGTPLEISHSYPLRGEMRFQWQVRGRSESGTEINITTNESEGISPLPGERAHLSLQAAVQTPRIRRSGDVAVDIRVSNPGGTDIEDVILSETTQGEIYRFAVIPAGGSVERSLSYYVNEDISYSFSIAYADESGESLSVTAAPVDISMGPDGVLPEGAKQRFIEFTGSSVKIAGSSTFAVLLISGFTVLLILIIMLIIASRRARIEKQLRIAEERKRRKEETGKTARAAKTKNKGRN